MKKQSIILSLMFFSLISGFIGAYALISLLDIEKNSQQHIPPLIEKEIVSSWENNEEVSSTQIEDLQSRIISIAEEVSPSVVSIIIKKDLIIYRSDPWGFFEQAAGTITRKVGGWSGFFVSQDGIILTNKHVISDPNAAYTVILSDGSEYDTTLLAIDPLNDLALIKIIDSEKSFIPLSIISETQDIQVGQFSIAVGNALAEFQNSVSLGIISGKDRTIEASGESLGGLIQTDAAINPGNSGGPLLDLNGNVIWVNTAIASGSNGIGFAIALSQKKLDYILSSIAQHGNIKRPFIGINYIPNSPGVAAELSLPIDYGVYIINEQESVIPGSSAEKAGLEPGDIIISVDGNALTSSYWLGNIIQNAIPWDILLLKVLKKSWEEISLKLELGEY